MIFNQQALIKSRLLVIVSPQRLERSGMKQSRATFEIASYRRNDNFQPDSNQL
ncbi:MAG: hypothetical protein F6K08_26785 [Okeania sp. SIO1H6]|nr:hypothetical protein [Okeania sp. SIO1H6]